MNKQQQNAELIAALQDLHPSDYADVFEFVMMRKLYRGGNLQSPPAEQWEHMAEWQKIRILWIVSHHMAVERILRNVRSLAGKAG
jgi:hypothetical protein